MIDIINSVNSYKVRSAIPLTNQQAAYIPTTDSDHVECMVHSYLLEGRRQIVNPAIEACFKLKYLRFRPMEPRKARDYLAGIWPFQYLVDIGVIYPFMFFINGLFIPWELMSISINRENYYILIDTRFERMYSDLIKNVQYTQTVSLPVNSRYERHPMPFDFDIMFSFNEMGEYDVNNPVYSIKKPEVSNIIFNRWNTTAGVNAYQIFTQTDIKVTKENITLFINGRLATDEKKNIRVAQDGDYKNEETGHVGPCLEIITRDYELDPNPNVKLDSILLSIGNGLNDNNDTLDFVICANTKYYPSVDNISKVVPDAIAPLVQAQNAGEEVPNYFTSLQTEFGFAMDRQTEYSTNLANAIKYILGYNASLFNSVLQKNSNLVFEEHTGAWVNAQVDEEGLIYIPRSHNKMIEEFILVLVNGQIYQYYRMGKYKANRLVLPIQGINDDDVVEFLRFQNVNNHTVSITIHKDEGFVNHSPEIVNDDMILFCKQSHLNHYEFPTDGIQHFPVGYTLETDPDTGYIKVTLEDDFYYEKELVIAYNNRYKHFNFVLEETTDKYTISLGDKFMYCHDYSKYFVFLNGRRLGSDHFRFTLPVRPTTPFTTFEIYLAFPVQQGDRLDVLYVPSLMKDVIMIPEIPTTGDIVIDKSILDYGLSSSLYMVWVNGRKVPASHIADIDSRRMRITTDEKSTEVVCITKYIPNIEAITNVFTENESLWDQIIDQLTNEEIWALLGITGTELTNTEENIYSGAVHIKSIMYELIREQFVMNPRVDITGPFIYDYLDVDTTAVEGYDSAGNALLPVFDSNMTENLDNVERPWP